MNVAARRPPSLRKRLFRFIIAPLVLVALVSSIVTYVSSQATSRALYDDTLRLVAHAVAREVVLTKGDLVADSLRASLVGALGDPIYYQVRAADGRFVTGHSDAPPPPRNFDEANGDPFFFDAVYQGNPVRAVMLREYIADPDFSGWTNVQVWQTVTQRQALSLTLLTQSVLNLVLVIGSAALLVWFGINRGLAPLRGLRDAVGLRSESDLSPIKRAVPAEVSPLVTTINTLFARLQAELERRNAFIGNAAHQLRNPVASIQAQADAALSSSNEISRLARLEDLSLAARQLSRMSQQLLKLDVANHKGGETDGPPVEVSALVADVARRHVPRALKAGVDIELDATETPLPVRVNRVMLEEAVDNLIDNALKYGCSNGGKLHLSTRLDGDFATITVADDGPGIPPEASDKVFERFVRLSDIQGDGCGLGLSIVRAIATGAGGDAVILPNPSGCTIRLTLPRAA
ncbi:sensor histidine kinase N-terminal domain-containing protein [Aliihoeflea sp. PC F10.4]